MRADELQELDRWLAINQPRLKIKYSDDEKVVLIGLLELTHEPNGSGPKVFDAFEILIEIPKDFPTSLPKVFETSGRIPLKPDFHINENGSICYGVPEIISARRPDLSLEQFITCLLYTSPSPRD